MGVVVAHVDSVQDRLVVADALDHRPGLPHVLAPGHHFGVVNVVEMVGGVPVVFHDETRLTLLQEEQDPLPFILGVAMPAQLEHPPGLGAVHTRVGAPQVRWDPGRSAAGLPGRGRDVLGAIPTSKRDARSSEIPIRVASLRSHDGRRSACCTWPSSYRPPG